MTENFCFTDETRGTSEFYLDNVNVRINKNYITKFDKFHRPLERVLKSRSMQIIGFNGDNKVTITVDGNFNISVEHDQYINMSSET